MKDISVTAGAARSTDLRKRQAALLSLAHHTEHIVVPNFVLPASIRPMPFKRAARLLKGTNDADTAKRIFKRTYSTVHKARQPYLQRAFQTLDAGNLQAGEQLSVHDDHDFAELPPELQEGVVEQRPLPPARGSRQVCPCCVHAATVHGYRDFNTFPIRLHDHEAWFDLDTSVATIVIRLRLRPPKREDIDWDKLFARYMDPLNWRYDLGGFFRGSRPIEVAQKKTSSQEGWSGDFLERVRWCQNQEQVSFFENVLGITFTTFRSQSGARLKLLYGLNASRSSEVAGWRQDGGLDVDEGYALVWRHGEDTLVEVLKRVRFTSRPAPLLPGNVDLGQLLNFTAPAVVGLWMDALVYRSAEMAIAPAMPAQKRNVLFREIAPWFNVDAIAQAP